MKLSEGQYCEAQGKEKGRLGKFNEFKNCEAQGKVTREIEWSSIL